MLVVLPDTLAYRRPVAYVSGLDVLPQLGATELQIIEEEATLAILLSGCDCIAGMRLCAFTQNGHTAVWRADTKRAQRFPAMDEHQCVAKVSSPSHPLPHSLLLDTTEAKTPCKDPRASGAGGPGALTDDIC